MALMHAEPMYAQVTTHAYTYADKKELLLQRFRGNLRFRTASQYNVHLKDLSTSERRELSSELTLAMGNYQLKEAPTVRKVNFDDQDASSMTVRFYFSGDYDDFNDSQFIRNLKNHVDHNLEVSFQEKKRGSVKLLLKIVGKAVKIHSLPGLFNLLGGKSFEDFMESWDASDPFKNTVKGVAAGGTAGGMIGGAVAAGVAGAKTGATVGAPAGPVGAAIGGGVGAVLGGITGYFWK